MGLVAGRQKRDSKHDTILRTSEQKAFRLERDYFGKSSRRIDGNTCSLFNDLLYKKRERIIIECMYCVMNLSRLITIRQARGSK